MSLLSQIAEQLALANIKQDRFREIIVRLMAYGAIVREEDRVEQLLYDDARRVENLLEDYFDVAGFRLHHDAAGIFSWWDYRQAGFRRDLGLRIDLTLVSDALRPHAIEAGIDREPRTWERPSDHAPAWVTLGV